MTNKNEFNTINMVKELADKLGYKVIKKERETTKNNPVYKEDPYKGLTSDKLMEKLQEIDIKERKLNERNHELVNKVIKFMSDEPSNELTKQLYSNGKFQENKVVLRDYEQVNLSNLKSYTFNKLKEALSKEFTKKFLNINEKFTDDLSELTVEDTTGGVVLSVNINQINKPKPKITTEENNDERNKTSMGSEKDMESMAD